MEKRKVFFGGTFDPVHNGHLIVARAIAETLGLERITLVPAARSPHKDGAHATGAERLAMLALATEGESVFAIADLEIHRTGPSYTVDTIRQLRKAYGAKARLAWVIGADMLEDLPKWHQVRDLMELTDLIVAVRPPWHTRLDQVFAGLEAAFGRQRVNKLRRSVIPTPTVEISSTDIRDRVARGLSIRYLVPEAVEKYIGEHPIYASNA